MPLANRLFSDGGRAEAPSGEDGATLPRRTRARGWAFLYLALFGSDEQ